jgi:anthranilate 1,2-dioxygenase small subunit
MKVTSPKVTSAEARAVLSDYTYALDAGRLADWPGFFTADGLYRITTRQNHERGYPLSIMLCDNRNMLYDRVEATEKANIFEPHYYRHVLSDSRLMESKDEALAVRTSFICVRTMLDGSTLLFCSGEYLDEVLREDGVCRFRSKTVILDQSRIDTLIAIPL